MADGRLDNTDPNELIQEAIIVNVLRAILPMNTVLMIFNLAGILFSSGFSQPNRIGTAFVALAFFLVAVFFVRRGRSRAAVSVLVVGLGGVALFAALMNGGLRAPAITAVLLLVSLTAISFGRRVGMLVSALSTVFLWVIFTLQSLGVITEPTTPVNLLPLAVLWSTFIWFIWSTVTVPQEKLREALSASFTREYELRLAQERTKEALLAFKAIFEQATHMVGLLKPTGEVLRLNQAMLSFLSESEDKLLGTQFHEALCWPPIEGATIRQTIHRIAEERSTIRLQTFAKDQAGQLLTIDYSISPFIEGGELLYLIVECRDVTEMMEAKERQERKQRLELVGQLAGGVAHDINNVLAAILSSAEMLRTDLQGESAELAQVIVGASHRARDLTKRLLTFARRTPIEKQMLSASALIGDTIELLSRTLPANIKIERDLHSGPDTITGNAGSLSSAIINLAVNARDAMPNGGTFTLATEVTTLSAEWFAARNETERPGDYLKISVSDTGHGIPAHLQPRIFEPFFSTKAEGSGTGLGLASVYGVVHDHQGVIAVSSQEGKGTTFQLYLPLLKGTPNRSATPVLRSFQGKRALLVDDETVLLQVNARLLGRLGIDCVTAPDAEAGLAEFQKDPTSFDLAVLDVVLPGRRGTELAIDLLFASLKIRVLLISGFQKEVELNSLSSTRIQMLNKPFTSEALQSALSTLFSEPERQDEDEPQDDEE
jgi:PAS domain S-box-containing protein